ncbi:MAG: amidohydrolase family protein [Chloroflexi bacterium]|nr:amidohydrolase family protein [Chloroflexota bacterium]
MNKLAFVDAHVHFYDMQHPELVYGHWQPGVPHPVLGEQIQRLAERNYLAEDYIAETRNANVTKAIHGQAAIGSPDPVTETEWLQTAADRTGFPHAIVAYADLRDPGVEAVLKRHCQSPNMRGIRDFSHGDYLVAPDFQRGFALLDKYNLVSSIAVTWQDMGKLRELAGKFPNVMIVVDHTGLPEERTDEYFALWKGGLEVAATCDNIRWKISGLGMSDQTWTVDSIRRWVLASIETFGVERCIFGTNWPVDWLWSTYNNQIDAYTEIISGFSHDEQIALFSGNAEKLYRI